MSGKLVTWEKKLRHSDAVIRVYETGEWACELLKKGQRVGDIARGQNGRTEAEAWLHRFGDHLQLVADRMVEQDDPLPAPKASDTISMRGSDDFRAGVEAVCAVFHDLTDDNSLWSDGGMMNGRTMFDVLEEAKKRLTAASFELGDAEQQKAAARRACELYAKHEKIGR